MRYGTTRAAPKFLAMALASNSSHGDWTLSFVRHKMPKSEPSSSLPSSWTQTTPGSICAEMNTSTLSPSTSSRRDFSPSAADRLRSPDQLTKIRFVSNSTYESIAGLFCQMYASIGSQRFRWVCHGSTTSRSQSSDKRGSHKQRGREAPSNHIAVRDTEQHDFEQFTDWPTKKEA